MVLQSMRSWILYQAIKEWVLQIERHVEFDEVNKIIIKLSEAYEDWEKKFLNSLMDINDLQDDFLEYSSDAKNNALIVDNIYESSRATFREVESKYTNHEKV